MTFTFRGKKFKYFKHAYNNASLNMRTIEVPLAMWYVKSAVGCVLEVGCVLPHYTDVKWTVLDLNEQVPGVINADIMEYIPEWPFDLIVSISTLEHVGYNKWSGFAQYRLHDVIDRLKGMLAPGGVLVATVPLGWRKDLDQDVLNSATGADYVWFMRLDDADQNTWVECNIIDALATKRGRWANAMALLQCGEFPGKD